MRASRTAVDTGALDRGTCLQLLAGHDVGHVAYTDRALPAIRRVHYALVGSQLVLQVPEDGLAAQLDGQVLAVTVDATPWAVVVTGPARLLLGRDQDGPARRAVSLACDELRAHPIAASHRSRPGVAR